MPFRASTWNKSVTDAWSSANLVNRMLVNLPTSQTAGRHSENNDKNSDRVKLACVTRCARSQQHSQQGGHENHRESRWSI